MMDGRKREWKGCGKVGRLGCGLAALGYARGEETVQRGTYKIRKEKSPLVDGRTTIEGCMGGKEVQNIMGRRRGSSMKRFHAGNLRNRGRAPDPSRNLGTSN